MVKGLLSREEIISIAIDFGFDVSFDSLEPGVFNSSTGELNDIEVHMTKILGEFNVIEEDSVVVAKQVRVRRYERIFEDYLIYEKSNIA